MRLDGRAIALALVAVLAAGLAAGPDAAARSHHVRLARFSSCGELIRYGRRHLRAERRGGAGPQFFAFAAPDIGRRGAAANGAPAATAPNQFAAPQGSSTTNVQEAGVDEPDLVKNDGARIFTLEDGVLRAIDASGPSPTLAGSLDLEGDNWSLLLRGNRLLAIGSVAQRGDGRIVGLPTYGDYDSTLLTEIDVSDPAHMRVLRTQTLEGTFVDARMTGDTARVVIDSQPRALGSPKLRKSRAGWAPAGVVVDAATGHGTKAPLTRCGDVRRPTIFSGLDTLTVLTIDMTKGLPAVDSDAILSDGQTVYSSPSALYVATEKWLPASLEREHRPPPPVVTAIHAFDASKPGETSYRGSGTVTGSVLNSWAMSERDGFLRVASTDDPEWWGGPAPRRSQSFMTVLADRGGALVPVGHLGGLGEGESIQAVRYVGDVAFLVTFHQIDPLFTLDLSNPARPRIAGKLKLRGYSAYLHPLGGDLLLGIGQDASRKGATLGTQLELFDIANPAKPVLLSRHTVAQGDSPVEYDPHAFLYWDPAKLTVLPLSTYGDKDDFAGAVGFHVARGSPVEETGRATHQSGEETFWIDRALVVNGRLFTVSEGGVEMDEMPSLAERAWVPFPQDEQSGTADGQPVPVH